MVTLVGSCAPVREPDEMHPSSFGRGCRTAGSGLLRPAHAARDEGGKDQRYEGRAAVGRNDLSPMGLHTDISPFSSCRMACYLKLVQPSAPCVEGCLPFTHPGDIVFRHACAIGLEDIVSKRLARATGLAAHPTG
jgi:hypothetical protein